MTPEKRQSSLRDYLHTIRRRWPVIVGVILIGALAALAYSLLQSKTYTATATMRFKDVAEELGKVGLLPAQGELPTQTAAQGAVIPTQEAVLEAARKKISFDGTTDDLRNAISSTQDVQSNLITVEGDASTAAGAARLANAVVEAAVDSQNRATQRVFSELAEAARADVNRFNEDTFSEDEDTSPSPNTPQEASTQGLLQALLDAQRLSQQGRGGVVLQELIARYEVVSQIPNIAAEVATEAEVPSSPSAPKPVRNILLGSVIGLVLGLIATALVESLDRRLRRPDEARDLIGFPLVGVVPDEAMGGVPVNGTNLEENVAAMDSFRMLRNNMDFLNVDDPPKTILVTSPLPEDGKTTVAVGLALASAAAGKRTLLVEADLHRPKLAERLGLHQGPGLADYLASKARPAEVLQSYDFVDPALAIRQNGSEPARSNLVCITAGTPTSWSAEVIGSERFTVFLRQVREVYDLVIVDTAPLLAVAETSALVPNMDAVVLCARLGRTTTDQARAGREALERLPARPTGLVLTSMTAAAGDGYAYYTYAYDYRFKGKTAHTEADTTSKS